MSNFRAFVVDNFADTQTVQEYLRQPRFSRVSWYNELEENDSIVKSSNGIAENDDQLDFLTDQINTTRYSFGQDGNAEISFATGTTKSVFPVDHVALAGVNWRNSDITNIRIEIDYLIGDDVSETLEVVNYDVSTFENNKVVMASFPSREVNAVRIYFEATGTVTLSIVQVGLALEFPCLPDVGSSVGAWNRTDEMTSMKTYTNNFGAVNIVRKGVVEKLNFGRLPEEFMNDFWRPFIDELKSQYTPPVFVQWNPSDFPFDVVFGKIDINQSQYTSKNHANVGFSINGLQGDF